MPLARPHSTAWRVGLAVVFDGVLAELQDDRQSGPFGAGDDAFGVLDRDDVEGGDGAFGVRAHEFVDRDDWHGQHLDAEPNHTQRSQSNARNVPTERTVRAMIRCEVVFRGKEASR